MSLHQKIYKLLRRSEKYTKTDMVYLAKGGFWLTAGQIISMTSTLLLAIALANLLPKEVYGKYSYILSIFSILTIANLSGINTALVRAVALGSEGSIFDALRTKIKWSVIGSLASLVLAGYYYWNNNLTLCISFIIVAVFVLLMENLAIYKSYLHGLKRFDTFTKYSSVTKIISMIFIVVTVYLSNNLFLLLLAFFVPQTIIRLIFLLRIKRKYKINHQQNEDTIAYGKKLSFINIISVVANQLDKILIFHYLGAVNLAIYSFALSPTEQIKGILKNIDNLAFPKFATTDKKILKKTIYKKSLKLSLITVGIVIVYIIAAPWLFKILFPEYLESVIYSQVVAISLITIPIWIFYSALKAQKATKQLLHINLINGLTQIVVTFLLVVNFGLWGAIFAKLGYRAIHLLVSGYFFKKI